MKKKALSLIALVLVLSLVFCACAKSSEETADTEKKYTIGVSIQGANNNWASASYAHFRYAFEAYADKIENIYYAECGYDDQQQLADAEDLLTKGIDALIIQPVSETSLAGVIDKAEESGVKVVVYGGLCGTDSYDAYVDRDHVATGAAYAQYVCDSIGGKGNVIVMMGYPGSGYSNKVLEGVNSVLANYPDVKVLGTEYAMYTPATSKEIIEGYFAKGDEIDGVICDGGLMGYGVLQAFSDAGKTIPPMTCDDTYLFLKEAVKLGFTDYLCCSSAAELSYDTVDVLFNVLAGTQTTKDVLSAPQEITGEELLTKVDTSLPDSYWYYSKIDPSRISEFYA